MLRGTACAALLGAVLLARVAAAEPAGRITLDIQRDHLALSGTWQRLEEHPDAEAWLPGPAAELGPWEAVDLPGPLLPGRPPQGNKERGCTWLRRTFALDGRQAARDAVLRWGGIRFGARAWMNGVEVGGTPVIAPAQLLVPPGTLREGENEVVLRVNGWGSLPKSANGTPFIPVGFDLHWGGQAMAAYDDVWLEFYDAAYMKWILALPDLGAGSVRVRVWLDAAGPLPEEVQLHAAVHPSGARDPAVTYTSVTVGPGPDPVEVSVRVADPRPWTPRDPFLYRAQVRVSAGGAECDAASFLFGMREVGVEDGHYRMNGEPLWFRGSNLVHEWTWWGSPFNREVKRYVVDEARNMNLNCFRTHTLPPNARWLDVCDEHGTMILAEFPTTFNYRDMGFTDEGWDRWHDNVLLDATAWMTKIWNHPSVVMWVLTNESNSDNAWEAGAFHERVASLDPTRPTLRTGETRVGTPSAVDLHHCGNYSYGPEKTVWRVCADLARNKDPRRALCHSEYMNYFDSRESRVRRRLGDPHHPDEALDFAECAAEDTEFMRRLDYDMLLPYMYAGWPRFRGNDWRPDYATPMAAALHSSMAPVLASLDLLYRNFVAGRHVTTSLHLINELHEPVDARLELCVTPANPLFVPDAEALAAAIWRDERDVALAADSHEMVEVSWPVPATPGTYYVAAVLRRPGDAPVVSQRTVRSLREPSLPEAAAGPVVAVVGVDDTLAAWLARHGVETVPATAEGIAGASVVLAWDPSGLASLGPEVEEALAQAVEGGSRLVIVQPAGALSTKVVAFTLGDRGDGWEPRTTRVFPYPGADHPMLAGIDPDCLMRWNGSFGQIVDHNLGGAAVEEATKILWAEEQGRPVAVALRRGEGEIVILTLHLRHRVDPGGDDYDPCAEQILLNLLGS
jgi:hypothetical protein